MVSIIMPAYNAERTIGESIQSVIDQTYTNWELIIINDCSSDNTSEVVSKYLGDSRIRYFENEVNLGVAETRNKGLEVAKYDYIAFLDSDDLWYPNKLEIQVNYMMKNNVYFSVTNYKLIDVYGNETGHYIKSNNQDYKSLLRGSRIGCLTVMINKSKIKPFKFQNIGHEDYALWLVILRENNISTFSINENLAKHRIAKNSLSSNKRRAIIWIYNIFRKEEKKNVFFSIYLIIRYALNVLVKKQK